jgi:hypothetical protein
MHEILKTPFEFVGVLSYETTVQLIDLSWYH